MPLPTDDIVKKVMQFLVESYAPGRIPRVSVAELKVSCGLSDDEYQDLFLLFHRDEVFKLVGGEWLQLDNLIGEYAARINHCSLNDVLQFTRQYRSRERLRRILPAIRAARETPPAVTLKAILELGSATDEGRLVQAVSVPWFEIMRMIEKDPDAIYEIDPFTWEEIIAGAYKEAGFDEVILTPRSSDKGRDVIATKTGVGSVRFFDQVKAYRPGHLVTAEEVRAMIGVVTAAGNVSKGIVTTTSEFAPRLREDAYIKTLLPYRLELKPRDELLSWLASLSGSPLK